MDGEGQKAGSRRRQEGGNRDGQGKPKRTLPELSSRNRRQEAGGGRETEEEDAGGGRRA
jgi:hypothetical protein